MKTTFILTGIGLSLIMLTGLVFGLMKISVNVRPVRDANSVLADITNVKIDKPTGPELLNSLKRSMHLIVVQAYHEKPYNFGNTNNNFQIPVRNRLAILPTKIKISEPFKKEYLPMVS